MSRGPLYVFFGPDGWREAVRRYLVFAVPWTLTIVAIVVLLMDPVEHFPRAFAISIVISEVCLFCCYWGSFVISAGERLLYDFKGWPARVPSGLGYALRSAVFMLPSMYLGFRVMELIAPVLGWDWTTPDFSGYRYGMTIGLFSLTIYVALDLYVGKRNADQSIKELESQNLKAQVAALTAQMNPHLLFNSLNSIASMIHDQPELAESMTVELSNLYRRVLKAVKHDKHSLAAELDLCRSYLEIERARFDERLKYVVAVDDAVDAGQTQIPVLCVQPFVENAVKHGLLAKVEGGTLRLGATVQGGRLVITVEDDGVGIGKAPRSQGSGTAIQNCRERLGILFGAEASLTIDGLSPGTRVTIQMPLVSMQEGKT